MMSDWRNKTCETCGWAAFSEYHNKDVFCRRLAYDAQTYWPRIVPACPAYEQREGPSDDKS